MQKRRTNGRSWIGICGLVLAVGCSDGGKGKGSVGISDASQGGSPAAGGSSGSGGAQSTGGNQGAGGSTASSGNTGGNSATGGSAGSGGALGTGGGQADGGSAAAGGSSGGRSGRTDGSVGGSGPSGGATPGGSTGSGDARGTGGVSRPGGTVGAGGAGSGGSGGASQDGGPGSGGNAGAGGRTGAGGGNGVARDAGSDVLVGDAKGTGDGSGGSCYASPAAEIGTQAPGARVTGYGTVMIMANSRQQIVRLQTTMVVPPKPPAQGTLFLWPGLDPDGANFDPINNGVLQPVLTWGSSCAPGTQPRAYSTWWISAQYVNTNGNVSGYTGCQGGPVMSVNVCDTLDMDIALSGTVWTQTVLDVQTNQTVTYSIDMKNQAQNLAYFVIEEYSSAPVSEVIFTNTTITFGAPDAADCKVNMRGQNDYVSTPVASSDGLECSIEQIILRAQGIP